MAVRHRSLHSNGSTRNQIVVSGSLILAVAAVHISFPVARPYTKPFYQLPYRERNGEYVQGMADACFVLGWLVLLTGLRASIIAGVYQLTTRYRLIPSKACVRFSEQSWLLFYDSISFSLGMHILMNSSYWLNFRELWSSWPSRQISGQLKWYYLVQLAFWLQQLLAVNLEKRRKDYAQMFTHHVVTCILMYVCYAYRYTKIGNVILCIMDVVDFILPLAKMLKYMGYESACNAMFALFLATWVIGRHGIYIPLWWSIYRNVPLVMSYGCYSGATMQRQDPGMLGVWRYIEPFLDQKGTICLDPMVKWVFLSMLLMLQILCIVWFAMILKVAFTVLKGGDANDMRSDDEDEEGPECIFSDGELKQALSAGIRTSGSDSAPSQSKYFQRGEGRIRIRRSRDRKEMIGRVGCNGNLEG